MIEEQFISPSDSLELNDLNVLVDSNEAASQFLSQWLNQSIIKLTDDLILDQISQPSLPLSSTLVEAMQRLVLIVAKLRSPDSGWPQEIPFNPEHLLPYASEEAYEVYEAFKTEFSSSQPYIIDSQKNINLESSLYLAPRESTHFVNDLMAKLLWYLASRSEEIMQLLTGIKSQVSQNQQSWLTGELRLVASLNLKTDQLNQFIDLATQQPPQTQLAADHLIQSKDCSLVRHPKSCHLLLKQLQQKISETSVPTNILDFEQPIEFLTPGKTWQQGTIKLQLSFEFIEHDHLQSSDEDTLNSDSLESQTSNLSSVVRLTEPIISKFYCENIIQKKLISLLQKQQQESQQTSQEENDKIFLQEDNLDNLPLSLSEVELTPPLVTHFIESACELVDEILCQTASFNQTQLQPEILLETLTQKLLWQTIRSRYQIMQLIAGIKARVLQPGGEWQIGTLRLLVLLNLNLTSQNLQVDIATNQFLKADTQHLEENAIIQSDQVDFSPDPIEAKILVEQVLNQLKTTSIEIELWMDGVAIQWQNSPLKLETPRQTGLAHLSIHFEWMSQKTL